MRLGFIGAGRMGHPMVRSAPLLVHEGQGRVGGAQDGAAQHAGGRGDVGQQPDIFHQQRSGLGGYAVQRAAGGGDPFQREAGSAAVADDVAEATRVDAECVPEGEGASRGAEVGGEQRGWR